MVENSVYFLSGEENHGTGVAKDTYQAYDEDTYTFNGPAKEILFVIDFCIHCRVGRLCVIHLAQWSTKKGARAKVTFRDKKENKLQQQIS